MFTNNIKIQRVIHLRSDPDEIAHINSGSIVKIDNISWKAMNQISEFSLKNIMIRSNNKILLEYYKVFS